MAVADVEFIGNAHPAMHLNHFMTERDAGIGDEGPRSMNRSAARDRPGCHCCQIEQGTRLLECSVLRDHAVL